MSSPQNLNNRIVSLCLLWGFVLPQLLLVVLNVRAWILIGGEATKPQMYTAITIFAFETVILASVITFFWLHSRGKLKIGWQFALAGLVAHVFYMWWFTFKLHNAIPNTIQPWILNEGDVGRWTMTLFMPGAFLCLYALTRFLFSRISHSKGTVIVIMSTIGMPVMWYILVSVVQPAWLGQLDVIGSIIVATICVVTFLGAVVHLFGNVLSKSFTAKHVEYHYAIAVILGLAAPLGGLILNRTIPFPTDFQLTSVYAMTIVNALVLLIRPGIKRFASSRLFLRCAVLPFIAYFFLVFLPFLPLSLFAIIVAGAGFLMLTPLALGLFQFKLTAADFRLARENSGITKAIATAIAGLLILPGYFSAQALLDKRALDISIAYFYSHDISGSALSESEVSRASKALVQLRDRKSGIQLPYISGFYNAIVFGNLVLSDKKITRMYHLLTNDKFPKKKLPIVVSPNQRGDRFRGMGLVAPTTNVALSDVKHAPSGSGETTVKLTLQNATNDTHSLYVGDLVIPEGVFITDLRLKIENEWVSGKIFDRKTALWVFQKITEVRRDPALLYYKSPTLAELRVYPFPAKGVREVEIDFSFHPSTDARINIDDNDIDFNPTHNVHAVLTQNSELIGENAMKEFAFTRNAYLHIILDYSTGSKLDTQDYVEKIVRIAEELKIPRLTISAANIGSTANQKREFIPITETEKIANEIENIQLPKTGGLWVEQAIVKEIMRSNDSLNESTMHDKPVYVIVGDKRPVDLTNVQLGTWQWLIPDTEHWYSYFENGLSVHRMWDNETKQVIAIKQANRITILPANQSSLIETKPNEGFEVFDPLTKRFTPLSLQPTTGFENVSWSDYAKLWTKWRKTSLNPAAIETERDVLLKQSKALGFLIPTTSLIVVERASQWEILKRKEKQSLSNHSGLDFEDEQQTPEPPAWLLLTMLLLFLYFRDRRRTRLQIA